MENVVNKLVIELLSQPIFLVFFTVGILGLAYSVIKNVKQYSIYYILFILILALSGFLGKKFPNIMFVLALIVIIICFAFIALVKRKQIKTHNCVLKESIYNSQEDNICPKCGEVLKERIGKYGKFWGCSNYPNCKFVRKINKEQNITVNVNITEERNIESVSVSNDNKCPKCGAELILKNGKYGKFYGCTNYPKCKYTNKM